MKPWPIFILLTACAGHAPISGRTPDVSWSSMNWSCWHEAYRQVPMGDGAVLGVLVGGAVGGALAGAADTANDDRATYFKACAARHGWQEVSD